MQTQYGPILPFCKLAQVLILILEMGPLVAAFDNSNASLDIPSEEHVDLRLSLTTQSETSRVVEDVTTTFLIILVVTAVSGLLVFGSLKVIGIIDDFFCGLRKSEASTNGVSCRF